MKRSRRQLLALTLTLPLIQLPMTAHAIEEPAFELLKTLDAVEIRRYAPYVVAEVIVASTAERAGNDAFPILAGYIFGKNKGERKMAMTAPVTQSAEPKKMAMTAPVTQSAAPGAPGSWRVQFVLPRSVSLAEAPEPLDARVSLREVPPARWAVLTYSGRWTPANDNEQLARLKATLTQAGIAWAGEPLWARYNGPFTPGFMRRNEVWLNLPG